MDATSMWQGRWDFLTDFKASIIEMLQQAITSMLETNEVVESISKETEDRKKSEWKFRTEKNTIT